MTFLDFITDKNGDGDEFRVLGWIFLLGALGYGIYTGVTKTFDVAGFAAIAAAGTTLLYGGAVGDRIKPTVGG